MQYALVAEQRSAPFPKAKGVCPFCSGEMTARCGKKKAWHWAHKPKRDCDPWWENETDWHRQWKSRFPEDWREVVHFDESGEKHIADVKTADGVVFEFQNSPMSIDELNARESFYGNVIWIVNGKSFEKNFTILDRLPNPDAEFSQDIVFCQQTLNRPYFCYWRRSQNPHRRVGDMVRMLSPSEPGEEEILSQIDEAYVGHHWFDWKHQRDVWLQSEQRVLIDFARADNLLVELTVYRDYPGYSPFCVQYVCGERLIESHGGKWTGDPSLNLHS